MGLMGCCNRALTLQSKQIQTAPFCLKGAVCFCLKLAYIDIMSNENHYPDLSSVSTGLKGKCPRCGRGSLFDGFLNIADKCNSCGLDYKFADAGDGASWFVMVISSTLTMAGVLWVEFTYHPAYWVHALVAIPLAVGLPFLLLRPGKAILVNQQYKTDAAPGKVDND